MLGSLLGSVASGVLGLFGQSSANDASKDAAKHQYQWGTEDMMKAGLNPAAMYSGKFAGAPMPSVGNTMAPMSTALKDAASSAVQVKVANATIDKMADEMAKLKAETAATKAGVPGIGARSALDVLKTDAIKRIPEAIRVPIYQGGFGADQMSSAGKLAAGAGATAAVGSGIARDYMPSIKISPPDFSSAKAGLRKAKSDADDYIRVRPWLKSALGKYWREPNNATVIYKQ